MFKLNKKGFASSIYIYSMFLFFIIIISMLLIILVNEEQNLKFGREAVKDEINKIVPYDIKLND